MVVSSITGMLRAASRLIASINSIRMPNGFFAECNTSLDELRVCRMARLRVTIRYYQGLAAVSNVKFHFVNGLNDESLIEALRQCGARSQLLSYADLKDNPAGMISYLWREW